MTIGALLLRQSHKGIVRIGRDKDDLMWSFLWVYGRAKSSNITFERSSTASTTTSSLSGEVSKSSNVEVERGMHLNIRVICSGLFDHRGVIPKLGGRSRRRFHARVSYKSHCNQLLDAMPLEL